jgi:hypothetical protein
MLATLRPDPLPEVSGHSPKASAPAALGEADDTEARMRKALGLERTTLRLKSEPERVDQGHRLADRSAFGGHRRRFVQDGDVPVTVLRRNPAAEPHLSRLQQVETQLATETAARTQAERALAEAQSQIRDLQTKFGHAELAKNEALEAGRRHGETVTELRSEVARQAALRLEAEERALRTEQAIADLRDSLETERTARKAADKALQLAKKARDAAEQLVWEPSKAAPVHRGRAAKVGIEPEPEPVKWWLAPASTAIRSRRH